MPQAAPAKAISQHVVFALKMLIAAPACLAITLWTIVLFPVSMPAWIAMEFIYGRRYGSGIRPVSDAMYTEVALRLMSWLACSTVAGAYVLILQYVYDRLNVQILAALAIGVGFAAMQFPCIVAVIGRRILLHTPELIHADNGTSFELRSTPIDLDSGVYRVTRRANDKPPITADFMCPCETPFLNLHMLSCNDSSVCLEGIFSTRAFASPATAEKHASDYAPAILQIIFADQSAPALHILKWLPLISQNDDPLAGT